MTYAAIQAQDQYERKLFAFKKEKVRTLAEKHEDVGPMAIWEVRTERGTSRDGFGLNSNPVSQKNRADKKHKKAE